jgi:hypothetical protein
MTMQEILEGAAALLNEIREAHDLAAAANNPAIGTLTVARSAMKNAVDNLARHVKETPLALPVATAEPEVAVVAQEVPASTHTI